ncbi:YbhB/YbcL family Raf kinase inhibitor-like protein [Trinickia fusca]|uniref:YbhB/YbcL family Raf kinase inhibitor-like protein n=1 Tax=Trinickia fusca TaxID=2419777 RepID=A0A494X3V2_9BURK|nr:YbhB/YbcL family Raf kinase inhibitor-like protein [Trinickia fusca]
MHKHGSAVTSASSAFKRRPARQAAMAACLATLAAQAAAQSFTVTSTSLQGGRVDAQQVYDKDGCTGGNRSPQLSWRNPPPGTRSFAVTMFDPDAPGKGWWHWAVAGIPASVTQLPENASASGFLKRIHAFEARNDYDADGYGGPCPPPGKPHRYVITVYALGTTDLRLAPDRPPVMFDHEIQTTALGSAKLTVEYGR